MTAHWSHNKCYHCYPFPCERRRILLHFPNTLIWPYSVCLSACATPPGLWTALQGLEYGSSPCQQACSKAGRRCVFPYKCAYCLHADQTAFMYISKYVSVFCFLATPCAWSPTFWIYFSNYMFSQLAVLVSLCGVSGDHSVCLRSTGGCQKRLREDTGSDDRDFIKRMKGDFDHSLVSEKRIRHM